MAADDRPWMIMKFGGTSVGLADRMVRAVEIIRATARTHRPVVVLSAMSSHKKSEGTTSRLLHAAAQVLNPASRQHLEIVDALEADHLSAARKAIDGDDQGQVEIRERLVAVLQEEFAKLRAFLQAAEIIDEISPRSRDVVIGTGEKLSCAMFTAILESRGIHAVYVPLDRCVDAGTAQAFDELDQKFYDQVRRVTAATVERKAMKGGGGGEFAVPVVTGYMGYIPGGIVEAIGRGYTDFTAALIAAGLKTAGHAVTELQIWKEVDGIFTADPRKVPTAKLLTSISPDEAAELTFYGSEVIHPFTMEQVIRAKVPIRIKNTFNPAGSGTAIQVDDDYESLARIHISSSPPRNTNNDTHTHAPSPSLTPRGIGATACTLKTDVYVINVHSNRKSVSHGFLAKIFQALDRHGIAVDMISTSEVHVSLVVAASALGLAANATVPADGPSSPIDSVSPQSSSRSLGACSPSKLDLILRDLRPLGEVSVLRNMAILSLVGKQMRNMVGGKNEKTAFLSRLFQTLSQNPASGMMFTTLAEKQVNIEMISQGASEINISCVVLEEDAVRGLVAIHDRCVLGH